MYYFIRFIFVTIFILALCFAVHKSKRFVLFPKFSNPEIYQKYCTDKKYRKSCNLVSLSLSVIILIVIIASLYPYEGHFMTFETINDSLSYKNINTENIDTYEYDDCVFVVDSENNIYSITKEDNKYKLVDFNSENINYTQPSYNGGLKITEPKSAKFNKDTNKTFYYLGISTEEKPTGEVTMNDNKMTYCKEISKGKDFWIYSLLDNAQPVSDFTIKADSFQAEIYKTPYIKGVTDK